MARTITHLYDTHDEAAQAVRQLEAAGIASADISIVGRESDVTRPGSVEAGDAAPGSATEPSTAGTGAGAGATLGTVLGGGAGLLAGLGTLAIPGVGPVVAAGWLIATLTGAGAGAAAGGVLGSLIGTGHNEADAHVYAEGLRRGGTLVSVRVPDGEAARIESLLASSNRVDLQARGDEYRAGGWTKYDETAPGYEGPSVTPPADAKRPVASYETDAARAARATETAVTGSPTLRGSGADVADR